MPTSTFLPKYPVDRDEQTELAAEAAQESPESGEKLDRLSFAQEVREERLSILWRVTFFFAFMAWWVVFVITGGQDSSLLSMVAPAGSLIGLASLEAQQS